MLPDLVSYLLEALEDTIDDRLSPEQLPQASAMPALVYSPISEQRLLTMDGPTGAIATRVQIDAWATSYGAAWELAELVRAALDGYRGDMGETMIQGIECLGINPAAPEPETKLKRVSRDYRIWHVN